MKRLDTAECFQKALPRPRWKENEPQRTTKKRRSERPCFIHDVDRPLVLSIARRQTHGLTGRLAHEVEHDRHNTRPYELDASTGR